MTEAEEMSLSDVNEPHVAAWFRERGIDVSED